MTHHIHSCIVSLNRLSLTMETLCTYLETVTLPNSVVIVDNASEPDVVDALKTLQPEIDLILLPTNRYPGYATNRGWELAPSHTTLFHRIDNDTRFLPDWCDEVVEAFEDPHVGQFGLVAAGDEEWTSMASWPIGGNSIIRRELYDAGLRYSEEPWSPGYEECPGFTRRVREMGYDRVFGTRPGIEYLDDGDLDYRVKSHQDRGLVAEPWKGATL